MLGRINCACAPDQRWLEGVPTVLQRADTPVCSRVGTHWGSREGRRPAGERRAAYPLPEAPI